MTQDSRLKLVEKRQNRRSIGTSVLGEESGVSDREEILMIFDVEEVLAGFA